MPARQLARLIDDLHPGVSIRHLENQAGVPPQTVSRWLKPGKPYTQLPNPTQIRTVARVLGARVGDVVAAFNASLDDPLPLNQLPDDEMALLARYRRMASAEKRHLLAIAETLDVHSGAADQPAGKRNPKAV